MPFRRERLLTSSGWLGRISKLTRAFRNQQLLPSALWRKKDVKYHVERILKCCGWTVGGARHGLNHVSDLQANKHGTRLMIFCSGTDSKLAIARVKDGQQLAIKNGLTPVFVYGEARDPQLRTYLYERTSIWLRYDELDRLDRELMALKPRFLGAVDNLKPPTGVHGWVKLNPQSDSPIIRAFIGGRVIGEAVANEHRKDLEAFGDGRYGFTITLNEPQDTRSMVNELTFKIFLHDQFVDVLPLFKGLRVN